MSDGPLFHRSKKLDFKSQSGQVAVIVFLIMAVLLVIGLSLAARTSQEIELAGQQEDTTRVFNAAETGIEQALSDSSNFEVASPTSEPIANLNDTQTSGTVTIRPEDGFENTFEPGETATVFTTGSAGNFDIWWSNSGTPCASDAVLAITTYIENSPNNYTANHYGVRPRACADSGTNFLISDNVAASGGYAYRYRLPSTVMGNVKMVRIKPLRQTTSIMIAAPGILMPQRYNIRSEAQDTSTGNTEVRAIEVTRSRPAPPSVFDYALYSGGDLTK